MCGYMRDNTKTYSRGQKKIHLVCVTCLVLCVTCHLSLLLTATQIDTSPAHSPHMHSRLVCKKPKKKKNPGIKTIQIAKTLTCLEVCQYSRYALQTKVSSPPRSGVFKVDRQTSHRHCDL